MRAENRSPVKGDQPHLLRMPDSETVQGAFGSTSTKSAA